jgi:hypothetical protein
MLKSSFTTVVLVFMALLWTSSIMAQETGTNSADVYTGPRVKALIQDGQNVPFSYPDAVVLYDNGPLVTHPGGGFGGADASALQTGLGMGTYGYGFQITAGNSIADDFTIPSGAWNIDELHFFGYQTNGGIPSTINDIRVQIYDGDPSTTGTVIWGDLTTNVLAASVWTNAYRTLDTDLLASNRAIMDNMVLVSPPLNLAAGTYWIEWQCGGTAASGPWAPPVTVLGSTGTGNAQQNTGTWAPVVDVGPQDFPFILLGNAGAPCPVDPPTNPDPADGATGVSINLASINWTNGAGATNVEVWFDGVMIYDGVAVSTYAVPGPLTYATTYPWQIVGKNDTCSTAGPTWTFTTMDDPLLVVDSLCVYPMNVAYWTGTTDGATKTDDSEVRGFNTEDGWMMFDISAITDAATITQITFWGYVNATNWPYWSATPLPGLNPLTATASELKTAIEANSGSGTAYLFQDEGSGYATGWKNHVMENTANADLQAALASDWFAMGMDSRDNSATYFVNWDGWNQVGIPYLCIIYEYVIPVELTSFAASVNESNVTLNWTTATETNNMGFEVQRSSDGNEFANVGFVEGNGTTTEIQNYTFTDNNLEVGVYSYRLRQIDFDGTSELSDVVETEVLAPDVFSLEQNYPNPFNPSTMISFSLAVDSKVSLTVFDVLGQEVVNLVNGNLGAGSHEIDFNASNLNSGVYFYRVNATGVDGTNFTSVKKMILTK